MQNKEKAYETEKTFQSDRNNRTEFIHEFENNYEAVIEEIQNKRRFGNLAGVDITRVMLDILGHPEEGMRYIHIAGTNGKGSVSAFLCSILREAGLKVGMFTSPHLVDFRERIQINGEMISKEDVLRLGKSLLEQDFGVHPTMFDYCLCMAVAYFKEQKCDVAVIETGLGGRLDSTNALGTPKVGIITKLGFDHTAILGNTIEEIAKEKAGIIKSGMKLVCKSQEKAAEEILQNVAAQNGISEVTIINENDIIKNSPNDLETEYIQSFSYRGFTNLKMKLLGVHQYENAVAAALAAEYYLKDCLQDMDAIYKAVERGIACTTWKGRMELISKRPFFLIDGAHNENGVKALKKSLQNLFPNERFHFIMGVMADKDYNEMVEVLLPLAIDFKTVTVAYSRSLGGDALAECIKEKGVPAKHCESLEEALNFLGEEGIKGVGAKTIALGSLYFIGEVEAYVADLTIDMHRE